MGYGFLTKCKGDKQMKGFINKLANNRKLSSAIAFAGMAGACICNIVTIVAIYYNGMRKGVDVRDDYYFDREMAAYEERYGKNG